VTDDRTRPQIYKFTRWAVWSFATATAIAMFIYPGGTLRNPSTRGYSFFQNFLSDLGTTVTWGGHPNTYGSSLFVLSVVCVVLAVIPCFRSFIKLYSSPASRKWTRAATVTAVCAAIGFIAVALTPTDRFFGIHFRGVLVAFESTLLTSLFFSFATARDSRFPKRVAGAWFLMTLMLATYLVVLTWGPAAQTDHGLVVQVTAQKITVAGVLLIVAYQTYEAERVVVRGR
jgi:hypothetical protein